MDSEQDEFDELLAASVAEARCSKGIRLAHLIDAGLIDPPLCLEADYTPESGTKTFHLTATIRNDGRVVVNDVPYRSLSMAASMAQQRFHAKPQGHEKHEINGWEFWRFRDTATRTLQPIDLLRRRYVQLPREKRGR